MSANTLPAKTKRRARPSRAAVQPITASFVPDALLTWATFVALTGCSETSLRRLRAIDPNFPPLVRLGSSARFRAGQVRQWMAAQSTASGSRQD